MRNFTKNSKLVAIIAVVAVIVVSVCFVNLYKEKSYWEEAAASYNYMNWCEIGTVASHLENTQLTKEKLAEQYSHMNGVIFTATSDIYPAFNGTKGIGSVLRLRYLPLAQDIANNKFSGEALTEALTLFKEMNHDLYELCVFVEKKAESDKGKIALRTVGSEAYREAEKEVVAFCDKYEKKVKELNEGL